MTGNDRSTGTAELRWLEGTPGSLAGGVTWGVPWPRGEIVAGTPYALHSGSERIPVQSWTTATWPDGTIKWSAHTAGPAAAGRETFTLTAGVEPVAGAETVFVQSTVDTIAVHTGPMRAVLSRRGPVVIRSLEREGRAVATSGRLVSELAADADGRRRTSFEGHVETVEVEQDGPVRAVVLVTGRHTDGQRSWLPFCLRLSFHAGSDQIRMVHSLVWDGDPERDFLCALGLRFGIPMSGPLHDRHIRIAGSQGFLTESVRPISGLWRDPGAEARTAQIDGRSTPATDEWPRAHSSFDPPPTWDERLSHVPAWNDWTLTQLSADGYTARKRTREGYGWVTVPGGTRSRGSAYVGGPEGGLEVGLRGFWQSHPTQIDIRSAATETAELTVWMWSPEARPMDLRFYHDGANEQTPSGRLHALDVTYEDYQPGFSNAHGIGRTHELLLRAPASTPDHAALNDDAAACEAPPQLVCSPERVKAAGVFGSWDLPRRDNATAAAIEDRLDLLVDYYCQQVEQRRWYGFWDYGDVMHSYDTDRHQWRYDIGGYAWANSELSPDLWLWLSFLRTGSASTFRLAEAMTRHTGEVDVYHAGRFAGFGTRHNVQHWGCSCKQLRVSNAYYRRFLYYLTADERLGDLLDEQVVTDSTFVRLDRMRAAGTREGEREFHADALELDLGIDLGALFASLLTQWERTGDPAPHQRILDLMSEVGRLPQGFFAGTARFNPRTGHLDLSEGRTSVSHLSAVFGLVEVITELLELVDVPAFENAWSQYCRLYLASAEEQRSMTGTAWDGALKLAHTRLLAWVANRLHDRPSAEAAWDIFLHGTGDRANLNHLAPDESPLPVRGAVVAEPVDELPRVTTNDAAQYGLAAIQNLALIADALLDLPSDQGSE